MNNRYIPQRYLQLSNVFFLKIFLFWESTKLIITLNKIFGSRYTYIYDTPLYLYSHSNLIGVFPQPFVWRNYISTAQGKKWWTGLWSHHFFPRLWKCNSHYFNDQNIHLFPEGFAFISCKYLLFISYVENLRTE